MAMLLKLSDLYLCPGDENGEHVTDNANICGCGQSNLVSLQRLLDIETTKTSMVNILQEECPGVEEIQIGKVYRS
jgi:hypothetical protein